MEKWQTYGWACAPLWVVPKYICTNWVIWGLCILIKYVMKFIFTSQWRHDGRDSVSNHQPHDCSLNRLFRRRSKKTSKLRVTGLYKRNSMKNGEFPAQMASYAENVSIWWRHHDMYRFVKCTGIGPSLPGYNFTLALSLADSPDSLTPMSCTGFYIGLYRII